MIAALRPGLTACLFLLAAAPALADDGFMTAQADAPVMIARSELAQSPHGAMPPLPQVVNFDTGANVKAMLLDGRNLWLGLPNGLIRYNIDSYDDHTIYTVESTSGTDVDGNPVSGLLANGIYAIDRAPDGALWISTYGGGLSRFDGQNWKTFTPPDLADRWAYDVEFAADGTMWVATWKGANRYDGTTFTTFTEKDGLIDKWVYDIEIAPNGWVWMGTEGGVSVYDGKRFRNFTHKDGLGADIPEEDQKKLARNDSRHHRTQGKANQGYNPNYVLSIAFTGDGAAWIGTWGAGLSRFHKGQWKTWTMRDGLGGNFVHALAVDPDGTLWAATDGGVSYLKAGRWTTISTRDGLMDDNVFSMLFEADGTRWIGTWKGLSKISPARPAPHLTPNG
ncbi:MAG: hypothetical protein OEY97_07210 [Nitrospirota bacterium]|nr:hypothetical protein [Nitrospirota bacterium]